MAIVANKQPELGRILYAGSNFPHPIQFCPSKEGPDHSVRNGLDLIWMAWSGFGQMHLVQMQTGVTESLGPTSGRMQSASYQFTTFTLACILPQTAWIILCKTSLGPVWFWLIVRFGPNRSSMKASQRARIIGPTSGQHFQSDPDRIWHVYWDILNRSENTEQI